MKEQEDAQVAILEEYAGHVKTMSAEEIKAVIVRQVSLMKEAGDKVQMGPLLKSLFAPGGPFDGKPVDRGEAAKLAKDAI